MFYDVESVIEELYIWMNKLTSSDTSDSCVIFLCTGYNIKVPDVNNEWTIIIYRIKVSITYYTECSNMKYIQYMKLYTSM